MITDCSFDSVSVHLIPRPDMVGVGVTLVGSNICRLKSYAKRDDKFHFSGIFVAMKVNSHNQIFLSCL